MSKASAASHRDLVPAPSSHEVAVSGQADGGDDCETVHLLDLPPPAGGGTCRCLSCGLVFQSRSATWVTNRRQHADNRFNGKFKSCPGTR